MASARGATNSKHDEHRSELSGAPVAWEEKFQGSDSQLGQGRRCDEHPWTKRNGKEAVSQKIWVGKKRQYLQITISWNML